MHRIPEDLVYLNAPLGVLGHLRQGLELDDQSRSVELIGLL